MASSDMKPEERAERAMAPLRTPSLNLVRLGLEPQVAKEIREAEQQARKEAFEEAMKAAHLVAEEYDVAGRKHVQMARKYADMRDGALAAETAIRSRAKEDQSHG